MPTRTVRLLATILLCVLPAAPLPADQEPTPEGLWLHANGRIRVAVAPCGAALCGTIVWLENPDDAAGDPLEDPENPDPARRDRPVLGMTVIEGMVPDGSGRWTGGTIYNPDDGETYRARVTMVDADTLHVRAYVLLPLFGETQVWTRVRE